MQTNTEVPQRVQSDLSDLNSNKTIDVPVLGIYADCIGSTLPLGP